MSNHLWSAIFSVIIYYPYLPDFSFDFFKLNDSGDCIIRKTFCIVFDMKRNVSKMKLFRMAQEALIAVF